MIWVALMRERERKREICTSSLQVITTVPYSDHSLDECTASLWD